MRIYGQMIIYIVTIFNNCPNTTELIPFIVAIMWYLHELCDSFVQYSGLISLGYLHVYFLIFGGKTAWHVA